MNFRKISIVITVLLVLLFPASALAAPAADDRVVFGGSFVLEEGEELDGNLLVVGGEVEIRAGATVAGNVILVGGDLTIDGMVDGDVAQWGGSLELQDNAHIYEDLVTNGGSLVRSEDARIDGEVRAGPAPQVEITPARPGGISQFIMNGLWNLFSIFASAALAVVLALLWPKHLDVVGEAIVQNPVMAGGVGLLFLGVAVPVLLVVALTLILFLISLLGFAVLAVAALFGWVGLASEIGKRIAEWSKQSWPAGLAAGVGAILLGLVFAGIGQIPCIGWAMQTTIALIGLGAVAWTRFGTQSTMSLSE